MNVTNTYLITHVDRSTMGIFYINMTKTIQMYSLAILMTYFLKENILSDFCVVQGKRLYDK